VAAPNEYDLEVELRRIYEECKTFNYYAMRFSRSIEGGRYADIRSRFERYSRDVDYACRIFHSVT